MARNANFGGHLRQLSQSYYPKNDFNAFKGKYEATRGILLNGLFIVNNKVKQERIFDHACQHGRANFVGYMLEKGVTCVPQEYEKNPKKYSPLHFAVLGGHTEIIKMLLEKDPTLYTDNDGRTGLQLAEGLQNREVLAVFDQYLGSSAAAATVTTTTTTTTAPPIVKISVLDNSPLHLAVLRGDAAEVGKILNISRELPQNRDGKSPFDLAVEKKDTNIIRVFLNYFPDKRNEVGRLSTEHHRLLGKISWHVSDIAKWYIRDTATPFDDAAKHNLQGKVAHVFTDYLLEYGCEKFARITWPENFKNQVVTAMYSHGRLRASITNCITRHLASAGSGASVAGAAGAQIW